MRKQIIVACLLLVFMLFSNSPVIAQPSLIDNIQKIVSLIERGSLHNQVKKSKDDDDNYNYDDNSDDNGDDDDDSNDIPLDGGLSFLAAAGVGLGIKKIRDNRAKAKKGGQL